MSYNNPHIPDHIQLTGQAFFDGGKSFMFVPDDPVPGVTPRFRLTGVAQQMSDGTIDFEPRQRLRSRSVLIKKIAHGRLSATHDGAIQLTLKIFKTEGIDVASVMRRELEEALAEPLRGVTSAEHHSQTL